MILVSARARPLVAVLVLLFALDAPVVRCEAGHSEASDPLAQTTKSRAPVQPARGGRDLIVAAETSTVVAVGRVSSIERVDTHGYAANFTVERGLRGKVKVGSELRIAWEELAASRPVRFAEGTRVLLCLVPPPDYTLWHKRFPENFSDILAVARSGEAFWREPDSKTLHEFGHYLALGREGRDDPAGLAYLVDVVAVAPERLALQVLDELGRRNKLATRLPYSSAVMLMRVAADHARPNAVRRSILTLVGRTKITAAGSGLAAMTKAGSDLRPQALYVSGQLGNGLAESLVAELLEEEDGDLRAVGASYVTGERAHQLLAALAANDPASAVRMVAVRRLLDDYGTGALDDIAPALGDEDPMVRSVAASEAAKLGADIVPAMEELANSGSERQAEGVVLIFTKLAGAGGEALARMFKGHPNPRIRGLAGLALGYSKGHDG